jgi:hypothetical protein
MDGYGFLSRASVVEILALVGLLVPGPIHKKRFDNEHLRTR